LITEEFAKTFTKHINIEEFAKTFYSSTYYWSILHLKHLGCGSVG